MELKKTLRDKSGVDSDPWGVVGSPLQWTPSVAVPLSPLPGPENCYLEDTVHSRSHLNQRGQVWSLMEVEQTQRKVPFLTSAS